MVHGEEEVSVRSCSGWRRNGLLRSSGGTGEVCDSEGIRAGRAVSKSPM